MFRLKSGKLVEYNQDFDQFFRIIVKEIIDESVKTANSATARKTSQEFEKEFIKEMMDNSIYVTHQIFDLFKDNPGLSKFIVAGFIFNSLMLNIRSTASKENDGSGNNIPEGNSTMH